MRDEIAIDGCFLHAPNSLATDPSGRFAGVKGTVISGCALTRALDCTLNPDGTPVTAVFWAAGIWAGVIVHTVPIIPTVPAVPTVPAGTGCEGGAEVWATSGAPLP